MIIDYPSKYSPAPVRLTDPQEMKGTSAFTSIPILPLDYQLSIRFNSFIDL